MKILIVSATHFEVKPLLDFLGIALPSTGLNNANMDFEGKEIQVLITGIGMVNTALIMGRCLDNLYDLIINAGICGAFDRSLGLGQVVNVTEDLLSELGAEDGEEFLTYDQLNLPGEYIYSSGNKTSDTLIDALKKVKGITVNTVHGNEKSIAKVRQLHNPEVESMEGAAFLAACPGITHSYIQIRAVSNYVEKRDKGSWKMALAIQNLNDFLISYLKN